MRIYGIYIEDTDIDYINCTNEQFIDKAETHGLIWEDISEFVRQLNNMEFNPYFIQFRYI